MPNNWKTYKLSQVIKIVGGGTPKTSEPKYWDGNIPWLSVKDFQGERKFVYETEKTISDEGLKKSSTKLLPKDSIIISARGTVGELAVLGKEMTFNQSCYGILPNEKVDNAYLYYLLKQKVLELQSLSYGSVFDTITTKTFDGLDVKIPENFQEQQSIASILSAIDDKIENNLSINKTLEEMAMALYKHWFVDFGPFRDGEFVESELGLIPKGWEVKKITELIDVKDGTHDSPKRVDEGFFLITSKHMTGNIIDFSTAYKISQDDFTKINKRSLVEKGDILMTMIGTVGNFYFVNEEPNYVIKNIGLFKTSKSPKIQSYLYSYFKSKIGQEYIKAQMTGSTQQYVTLNTLRNFDITVPNEKTLTEFNQITNDYFETIINRTKENQTLTQLRNALLPQLISGAVRLKEFRE